MKICDMCGSKLPFETTQCKTPYVYITTFNAGMKPKCVDLCSECARKVYDFVFGQENRYTAEELRDILVEHGQHDLKFKLGETIKYSPSDIYKILKRGDSDA